jgi:hypothetical protein
LAPKGLKRNLGSFWPFVIYSVKTYYLLSYEWRKNFADMNEFETHKASTVLNFIANTEMFIKHNQLPNIVKFKFKTKLVFMPFTLCFTVDNH